LKISYVGKCLLIEIERKKILVIGDLHLGYEEHLNKAGILISRQMFKEMIDEFDRIFEKTGKVDEVVLLGDVKHDFGSIMRQEWSDVLGFFEYLEGKCNKVIITKGNHDMIIGPIAKKSGVRVVDFYIVGETCFLHGDRDFDELHEKKIKFWVLGHAHPAIKIGNNVRTEKYKCFLVGKHKGKKIIIVPSFFSYFEGSDPRENDLRLAWNFDLDKFEVKIVQENSLEVLDFGKLGKLN
jgi:uncharacterized protein